MVIIPAGGALVTEKPLKYHDHGAKAVSKPVLEGPSPAIYPQIWVLVRKELV